MNDNNFNISWEKKLYFFIFLRPPCSKLQSFLLQQQTFLEKCETWMEFLVQTEESLAVEISGNYPSLVEQQKAHEVFVTPYLQIPALLSQLFLIGLHFHSIPINFIQTFIHVS